MTITEDRRDITDRLSTCITIFFKRLLRVLKSHMLTTYIQNQTNTLFISD